MKITFDRNQMLAAFSVAASVAPSRSPKVILQNVKVEATGEGVCLMATDLEFGIRIQLPEVAVEQPGACLLPVRRFMDIVKESNDTQMRLSSDGQTTVVKGDRSTFRLTVASAEEFPSLAATREERCHEVSARLFHELVARTAFATDTESSRYALAGVLLEFGANSITAVGTDGRRLAKMEGSANSLGNHHASEATTIVPTRAIQLMARALANPDSSIRIAARNSDVLVQDERVTIFARLVEGRFPRWRDVFPERTNSNRIQLAVGPLHNAIRQAAVVVSEESRGVQFEFSEGTLVLSANAAEVGESRVELPVSYSGAPVSISLDPRYVSDFLKVLGPEKMFTLDLENAESAALFSTDDGYGYVVMPMARDH